MSEHRKNRKVRWQAVLWVAFGLVVFALVLYWGQQRDRRLLEERWETLRNVQIVLQQQQSDKQQEVQMAESDEYIEQRAREKGYLMPGEIRFVVTNLDELLENGGEAETEIAEEGL